MLHKWVAISGADSERGLFLARAVLLYLTSDNMADANVVRTEFVTLGSAGVLGNFTEFLLRACQIGERAQSLFARLRVIYGPALAVDEDLGGLMDEVARIYFNIQPPPPSGMAGMMQSMMRGMMAN
jgi:hypothetical protein